MPEWKNDTQDYISQFISQFAILGVKKSNNYLFFFWVHGWNRLSEYDGELRNIDKTNI